MTRIQKNLLLTPNDIEKFKALAEKAHQITIDNLKKDEDYEDAPDEFIGKFCLAKQLVKPRLFNVVFT